MAKNVKSLQNEGILMKKLNEAQMIIFEEESARAIMLKKAKESLDEAEYQGLVGLLPEYESRAELSEVSKIDLYESCNSTYFPISPTVTVLFGFL